MSDFTRGLTKTTVALSKQAELRRVRESYAEKDLEIRQRLRVLERVTDVAPSDPKDVPSGWFALLIANCILFAEGILLHPVLDLIGVTDPRHQLVVSVVLVYTCAGAVKICFALMKKARQALESTSNSRIDLTFTLTQVGLGSIFAAGTLFLVGFLGKLRSLYVLQVIANNPELVKHTGIIQVGLIVLTAILPVVATIMWDWGLRVIAQQRSSDEYTQAVSEKERLQEELRHLGVRCDADLRDVSDACSHVLKRGK